MSQNQTVPVEVILRYFGFHNHSFVLQVVNYPLVEKPAKMRDARGIYGSQDFSPILKDPTVRIHI